MKKLLWGLCKIALLLVGGMLCLLLIVGGYVYHNRDAIAKKAFDRIVTQLPYALQVEAMNLSILEDFPRLSIVFHQVVAYPTNAKEVPMLTAQKVSGIFSLRSLFQGNYSIEHVLIADAVLRLHTGLVANANSLGTIKLVAARPLFVPPLLVDIKKFDGQRILVDYQALVNGKCCSAKLLIETLQAAAQYNQGRLALQLDGKLFVKDGTYAPVFNYQSNQPLSLKARCSYDGNTNVGKLYKAHIKHQDAHLNLQGTWSAGIAKPIIDLQLSANRLKVDNLVSWLLQGSKFSLAPAAVKGHINLTARLIKQVGWDLDTHFSLQDGSFLFKKLSKPVQVETLVGTLTMPDLFAAKGTLKVAEGKARWANSHVVGTMEVDLQTLQYKHQGDFSVAIADLLSVAQPVAAQELLSGRLLGKWQVDSMQHINRQPTCQVQLATHQVSFPIGSALCRLQDSTQLNLQDHTLFFPHVEGDIAGKKFTLAGHISHLHPMALSFSKPTYQATFYAEELPLDALVQADSQASDTTAARRCLAWALLPGTLTYEIKDMAYKNFRAKNLCGKLDIQPKKIQLTDVSCQLAKGRLSLNATGYLHPNHVAIASHLALHQVDLPALFTAFDNFNQTFLQSQHLEGIATATIQADFKMDTAGVVDQPSIVADAAIQLQEAVLKDFAPLEKLAPYTAEKKLNRLQFSPLKNNLHLEKGVITIPHMEVHTSLMSIGLSGSHGLDGTINYSLAIPLEYADKSSLGQFQGINPMAFKGFHVYLRLEGNPNQYTIRFDGDLFRANLQKNFANQLEGLKKLFQGQEEKKQAQQLSKEYFDFD